MAEACRSRTDQSRVYQLSPVLKTGRVTGPHALPWFFQFNSPMAGLEVCWPLLSSTLSSWLIWFSLFKFRFSGFPHSVLCSSVFQRCCCSLFTNLQSLFFSRNFSNATQCVFAFQGRQLWQFGDSVSV